MISQQIRAWDVFDARALEVLGETPREHFVPPAYRAVAFADTEIPLAHNQNMLAPKVEGRLLQAVAAKPGERALVVGTGSGFLAACLAQMASEVVALDIYSDLSAEAEKKLDVEGITNVSCMTHDARDFAASAEFDVIAITASLPELDDHFLRMLRPGGRMFVVVGRAPAMEARLVTMGSQGEWTQESLFETVLTPMVNAELPEPFVL